MHRSIRDVRLSILAVALLSATALPAFAADPSCAGTNGLPVPGNTNQGSEHGDSDTTCDASASAYGNSNNASAAGSNAFGSYNQALAATSNAFGRSNLASGTSSSAFGYANTAKGAGSSAFGTSNTAYANNSSAFGLSNEAIGVASSAFGLNNTANGETSSAFGALNFASGENSSAIGYGNAASGKESSAFGSNSTATAEGSSAFGSFAYASAKWATAIGAGAVADREAAVSVGKTGGEHQIIHLADGTEDTDAVNVRQLNSAIAAAGGFADFSGFASAFGGGAMWSNGTFIAPTFTIQGNNYNTVFDAFAAVDGKLTALSGQIGVPGPQGPEGPQGEPGPAGGGAMDTAYVDAGDAATLAESKAYTDSTATQTLNSAKAYTDSKFTSWNDSFTQFQQQVDQRFAQTDKRINRMGAMNSAMIGMAASAAAVRGNHATRIGAAIGTSNGRAALSVGLQRQIGDRAAITLGGAFSGNERSTTLGIGIGL